MSDVQRFQLVAARSALRPDRRTGSLRECKKGEVLMVVEGHPADLSWHHGRSGFHAWKLEPVPAADTKPDQSARVAELEAELAEARKVIAQLRGQRRT